MFNFAIAGSYKALKKGAVREGISRSDNQSSESRLPTEAEEGGPARLCLHAVIFPTKDLKGDKI